MSGDIPVAEGESVLKPIGDLAKLITEMSFEDYALFVIATGRKMKEEESNERKTEHGCTKLPWHQYNASNFLIVPSNLITTGGVRCVDPGGR